MVFMPPGSAKTTYTSNLFPTWFLGRNPDNAIILASYGGRLAARNGRRCRNIVGNKRFTTLFNMSLSADTQAKDEWETTGGGRLIAAGVGGPITGERADVAVIDDPIKGREEADSQVIRDKAWDWWTDDMETRLKPNGRIIVVMTRWHEDDPAGRILGEKYDGKSGYYPGSDGKTWRVICLPAIAEDNDILGREPGEPLWPEWFSAEHFARFQVPGRERTWTALFQQRPSPEQGSFFKADWFRWYEEVPEQLEIYGASDYAVTADGGDYTVHGVVGVDPRSNIYLLDWWRERTESDVWVESFIELCRRWKPLEWGEESGQINKGVGPFLVKRLEEEDVYVYRKQYASAADKATRAQSIRGRMAAGKLYFPSQAPWIDALKREMLSFPAGMNDDQVDVLSLIGRMLDRMRDADEPKPVNSEPMKGVLGLTVDEQFKRHFRGRSGEGRI